LPGVKCANHPEVGAEVKCKICRTPICGTCRFKIRGASVCPDCASAPRTGISTARKLFTGFSYGCAAVFSLAIGLAFACFASGGAGGALVGFLLFVVAYVTAHIGFALGVGALDKRLANPAYLWAAAIWNTLNLGITLFFLVGSFFLMRGR
jgi:hypothetical protein